jgi:carbon-monoxide dehydrogenase large subunit
MKQVAFAAYTNMAQNEPGLEATYYYDPPNMTYPNGAYVAVVDVDRETGETKVRRFLAVDDCGTVINPMIVEGQIHGGLTEGFAMAFIQEIQYDAEGNNLNTNFTDYLVPTSAETPHWETGNTVTPSPHHPMGAKGVGRAPNVRQPRRVRERRDRRVVPAGRAAHRHAAHARQGVARDPRRRSS